MRKAHLMLQTSAILIALVLLAACGTPARHELLLVDPTGRLNADAVKVAADPLIARGARVAIFIVEQGDATGADFAARLAAADLLDGDQIVADGIAIYVSSTPQFSALRVGSRFSERLSNAQLDVIRAELLNPNLRADEFSAGVVVAVNAIEAELAAPPPVVRWVRSLPPFVFQLSGLGVALILGWWGVRRWQLEQYVRTIRTDSYAQSRAELDRVAAKARQVLEERRPVFALRERQAAIAQFERTLAAYDAERATFAPDRDVRRSDAALAAQRAIRTLRDNYERLMLDIRNGARTPEEDAALNAALLDHVRGRKRLPIGAAPAASAAGATPDASPSDHTHSNDYGSSGGGESSSSGDW